MYSTSPETIFHAIIIIEVNKLRDYKNMTTPTLEDVLKFPCEFNIKIMAHNVPELIAEVEKVIQEHDNQFDSTKHVTTKPSSKGNYISLNAIINAKSKAQLDAIYTALNKHELVKITL